MQFQPACQRLTSACDPGLLARAYRCLPVPPDGLWLGEGESGIFSCGSSNSPNLFYTFLIFSFAHPLFFCHLSHKVLRFSCSLLLDTCISIFKRRNRSEHIIHSGEARTGKWWGQVWPVRCDEGSALGRRFVDKWASSSKSRSGWLESASCLLPCDALCPLGILTAWRPLRGKCESSALDQNRKPKLISFLCNLPC